MVMAMVDMSLTDDEILDMACPLPIDVKDRPKYPWGLKICLTQAEIDKLRLDPSEAFVGGMVHLHALARITSTSCDQTEGGENCRIELQIENLSIPESEDEENAMADRSMGGRLRGMYKTA